MRELKKQDRTSSRLPTDTERKYKLGQIELTKEELDKLKSELVVDEFLSTSSSNAIANKTVTSALNNKVTKEKGKTLSSNDFTDEYINKINNLPAGNHEHQNKEVLDTITQEKIDTWNNNNGISKTTIYSGVLIGGELVTLSGVKRYLDIYYRMNFASGDGMGKYTIEIVKDSIEMYSSGIIMAFDGSSGQEYYVSEGLYNQQTKVFTHTRIGYFNISTGQFTSRNSNDSYYIYQIDTYD